MDKSPVGLRLEGIGEVRQGRDRVVLDIRVENEENIRRAIVVINGYGVYEGFVFSKNIDGLTDGAGLSASAVTFLAGLFKSKIKKIIKPPFLSYFCFFYVLLYGIFYVIQGA